MKARSRRLTALVDSFTDSFDSLVGSLQRVCVTDTAADGHHLVAHTKNYCQVRLTKIVEQCLLPFLLRARNRGVY